MEFSANSSYLLGTGTDYARNANDIVADVLNVLSYIPEQYHASIKDRTITTNLSTYLELARDDAIAWNRTLYLPAGLYLIDGAAGDTNGGWYIKSGCKIIGDGPGNTILKNASDSWRMVLALRGGDNIEIRNLTIDGDWPNQTAVLVEVDAKRGEGIILWNLDDGITGYTHLIIDNIEIKNCDHYGIGIQNGPFYGCKISNVFFSNIGGDCIDIKETDTGDPKHLIIDTVITMDGCGNNSTIHDNQAVVDIGGTCLVQNVFVRGLNSYDSQLGNVGVRMRAPVISLSRHGAEGSIARGIFVLSSKESDEGSDSAQRIIGVAINCGDVIVSDVVVDGCFYGVSVFSTGDGVPDRFILSKVIAKNCTGADGTDAKGIILANASTNGQLSDIICDANENGFRLGGTNHAIKGIALTNNTEYGFLGTVADIIDNTIIGMTFDGNDTDYNESNLDGANISTMITGGMTVIESRQAYYDVFSTANDVNWTDDDVYLGGLRGWGLDTTGSPGMKAALRLRASGADGQRYGWEITAASDSTNDIPVARFRDYVIDMLIPQTVPGYVVSALPSASTVGARARAFVTDSDTSLAAGHGDTVAGGGANLVPVYSDGTNWKIG